MATTQYVTLYQTVFSQIETFLGADASYTTKKFERLEDTDIDEIEKNERLASNPYQFDLLISNVTEIDEETFFTLQPEKDEICGGFNTSDPVNGTGYYSVTFLVRITQPNTASTNDSIVRFTRPAMGNDILQDIFNQITGYEANDHTSLPHTELNDKQIILSESNFTIVTQL